MKISYLILPIFFLSLTISGYNQTANDYLDRGNEAKQSNTKIFYYSKAIALDPNFALAYLNRGVTKVELEDYVGALADLNKAIEIKSQNDYSYVVALVNRGDVKMHLNDYQGAISDYNKYLKIYPDGGDILYKRAIAKLKIGLNDSACLDLRKAGDMGIEGTYELIKKYCQ